MDSNSLDNTALKRYTSFPPLMLDDLSFFDALPSASTISTELSLDLARFDPVAASLLRSAVFDPASFEAEDDGKGLEGEAAACLANIDAMFPFLSAVGCSSRHLSTLRSY